MSDTLTDSRRFRVLAVVDDFTRECLSLVADTSLSGGRAGRELDAIVARRGRPLSIVSDNGAELTSVAILRWPQEACVEWHYIAPGKLSRMRSPNPLLAGCATTTAFVVLIESAACTAFQPIRWSAKDTDETIRQVKAHNVAWKAVCLPENNLSGGAGRAPIPEP